MNVTDQVEVRRGLPERHRRRAAEVYYDAFRQKFEPIMGSQEHGVAVLEKAFDLSYALVALHQDQLAGVAGVQYGGHHLVDFRLSDLRGIWLAARPVQACAVHPLFSPSAQGRVVDR